MKLCSMLHLLCAILVIVADNVTAAHASDVFEQDVSPIFVRRCLTCHSSAERKGDFSLQASAEFFADGYVEPGDAESSHLMQMITPEAGKAMMPKNADPLTESEVATIGQWINDGAKWPDGFVLQEALVEDFDWWSYQRLRQPAVPEVDEEWATTAIDRFIVTKLKEKGLQHSRPADRRTLIRRLTYDLIGLPPTPEEVDTFVSDSRPDAYDRLVSRLLDSQRYGEHWARHWLDVARYADSCGYDKDKLRPNAWPYRDYVIRSLNDDKPYSRFVQEQIAGDVLFPDEADGIVGLGFIAAGPWDFIGHAEVSESKLDGKVARNLDRDDMVSAALNTFCSLTVQCARCHNHKFDPITQEQYYGLQSIFAAVDRANRPYDSDPQVARQRRKLNADRTAQSAIRVGIDSRIAAAGGQELIDLNARITELKKSLSPIYPPEHGYHSQIAATSDVEKWVEVELPSEVPVTRVVLHACSDTYNDIGDGFGFPRRFKLEVAGDDNAWHMVADATQDDVPNPRLQELEFPVTDDAVRRVRITASLLAPRSKDFIFALSELEVFAGDDNVAAGATVRSLDSIEAGVRWSRNNLVDGKWPRAGNPETAVQIAEATRSRSQLLEKITTSDMQAQRSAAVREIARIDAELKSLPEQQMVYAAATDFSPQSNFKPTGGQPRDVFVLTRGEVAEPGPPAVPGVVPLSRDGQWQFDAGLTEAQRRARLAAWLTDREHPLVWRSIVNRVWQYHFGQGLVATPNDFGRMGAEPTHPELLDWLAVEFRDGGQSLKSLHRLIVTSHVYRQSSADIPASSAIDSGNQFLWRANRRRLSAEEIRDSILTVSGVMNLEMGGPGFYLFELEKTDHSPHFEYHKFDPTDEASHRRSIYRFIARSQPNPYMTTLDCADSSQSTPKRNSTLTSLQALSLLNNRFNLVMAERFSERLESAGSVEMQVRRAISLLLQRAPDATELSDMTQYAQKHGMTNLCRLLFNLSEFVFVD